jgi:hypothetical protein
MTTPLSRQVYRLSLSVVILLHVTKFIMVVIALSRHGFVSNPRIVIVYSIICDAAAMMASFIAAKVIPIYFVKDDIPLIDNGPAMAVVYAAAISLNMTIIIFLFIYVIKIELASAVFTLVGSFLPFSLAISAWVLDRRKNSNWYWSYQADEEGIPLLFLQKKDTHTKRQKKQGLS